MREVSQGDIIFSFRDTRIAALGIARSYCCESPKPTEFGTAGSYWEATAKKIDVSSRELTNRIHPKSHIGELRGLLPQKYSPLRANGDGLQSVYLAEVARPLTAALFRLIGGEANQVKGVAKEVDRAEQLSPSREPDLERWEERVELDIREDTKIPDTQREAIILARVGLGKFRANVQGVERACRVTKVERMENLVASHTKPWLRERQRLNGENGLLPTPTIDHLFDKGFISFEDKRDLIVSPVADRPSLLKMGIKPEAKVNVGVFSEVQRVFLEYHRENVLRMSRRR
jgi:putative restriction endonuclease